MADMDVFAAMGISGFGKATVKRQLDPSRFDKNKREEVEFQCLRHGFNRHLTSSSWRSLHCQLRLLSQFQVHPLDL